MSTKDIFALEFKTGKRRYILNKAELRCVDSSQEKNNFSIPLNQLDPYYQYGGFLSILWLLGVLYLVAGIIANGVRWFYLKPTFTHIEQLDHIQLIVFSGFLCVAVYQCYQYFKTSRTFRFSYLRDGELAFSLPKTTKNKTQQFVDTLVTRIHEAAPANELVLYLLRQYGLLTNVESNQLDAYLQKNASVPKVKQNVIHLVNS
jgi:hypothetical protein